MELERGGLHYHTILLTIGLCIAAPLITVGGMALGASMTVSGVLAVGAITSVYALHVLQTDLERGLLGAVIVTSMFSMNIPLTANAADFPGETGPHIYLVYAPILALATVTVWKYGVPLVRRLSSRTFYGLFVVWAFLSAAVANGPRPDYAVFFAIFHLLALVAFVSVVVIVKETTLTARDIAAGLIIAITGQCAVSIVQLINQGTFGLTVLGERSDMTVAIGMFGIEFGPYLAGFTGGPFATILILVAPAVFLSTINTRRIELGILFALHVILLRIFASDSARGGLLVAMIAFIGLYVWRYHGRTEIVNPGGYVGSTLLALFIPSSITGRASSVSSPSDGGGGTSPGGSGDPVSTDVSVPFADASTLGTRVGQIWGGLLEFSKFPLFGLGGGNFQTVSTNYISQRHRLHNIYVELLAETGLPGAVFYFGAVSMVLWKGLKTNRWTLALACGMLGVLAHGFFTPILDRIGYLFPFWIAAAAIVADSK
jgi:hypothetical protein